MIQSDEAIDWIECWLGIKLKNYQKRFVRGCIKNNRIAGLWPRQAGKSTIVAALTLYMSLTINNFSCLIIAPTLTQSSLLFQKIRGFIESKSSLKDFYISISKTSVEFRNGSTIKSLPCGPFGDTIRGHTANFIVIEESGVIKDEIVNSVIMPMVIATRGKVVKIGTPKGKNHFYKSCYDDSGYHLFHIDWRTAVDEGQYTMKEIQEQMNVMTTLEFAQEYEAKFIETADSFFTEELINSCLDDYRMTEGVY